MTETQNVATYARIRPFNPAINEDKKLTARAVDGAKILNQNGANEDAYNFTHAFDMSESTNDLFERAMQPLLDYKILQGINSIFIVYGQSGSGKSFTLIGEEGHLGVLPMSLQYLLSKDNVENIHISSIEAYGIKAAKIGFFDLVAQLKVSEEGKKGSFDPYASKDNPRLSSQNAETLEITADNCLSVITQLQNVSHMAPTLKNPHSSRGHTVYFCRVKMTDLEPVYFICVDLAGSEGQTALGTKQEFTEGLQLAMTKGKLHLTSQQKKGFEEMYKTRSLEAGCINNGLTQLQSIFGELIKKKISKAQGLGLRKVLSQFISLNSAYAILFTLSASANNNKVTRATLNFAKQTQLVKVDTQKAKKKIDKDKIIAELNECLKQLRHEMDDKNKEIQELKKQVKEGGATAAAGSATDEQKQADGDEPEQTENTAEDIDLPAAELQPTQSSAFDKFDLLNQQIEEAQAEEAVWTVDEDLIANQQKIEDMSDDQLKQIFNKFDTDGGGTISGEELQNALKEMGRDLTLEQVDELIFEIDDNGDGEVDFEEFHTLVGKSWFVDAYQFKLAKSLETMMKNMGLDGADDSAVSLNRQVTVDDMFGDMMSPSPRTEARDSEFGGDESKRAADEAQWLEIEALQTQVKQLQTDNEELQQKVSQLETEKTELAELKQRIAALEADNENLRSSREEEQNAQAQALQSEVEHLQNDLDVVKKQNEQLRTNHEEMKQRETDFKQENVQLRSSILALQSSMNERKNMVQENQQLMTEIDGLKNRVNELQSENQVLRGSNEDAHDAQTQVLETEVEKLKHDINGLKNENVSLAEQKYNADNKHSAETEQLKSKLQAMQKENERLEQDRNDTRQRRASISELQSTVNLLVENQTQNGGTQLGGLQSENELLKQQIANARQTIAEQESAMSQLNVNHLKDKQITLLNLAREMDKLRTQVKALGRLHLRQQQQYGHSRNGSFLSVLF